MNKPQVRFQRANYVVRDIERALTFYRDVLGFEETYRLPHNPESYSITVFDIPQGATNGFSVLSAPGQPRVMALTEIRDVSIAPVPPPIAAPSCLRWQIRTGWPGRPARLASRCTERKCYTSMTAGSGERSGSWISIATSW